MVCLRRLKGDMETGVDQVILLKIVTNDEFVQVEDFLEYFCACELYWSNRNIPEDKFMW